MVPLEDFAVAYLADPFLFSFLSLGRHCRLTPSPAVENAIIPENYLTPVGCGHAVGQQSFFFLFTHFSFCGPELSSPQDSLCALSPHHYFIGKSIIYPWFRIEQNYLTLLSSPSSENPFYIYKNPSPSPRVPPHLSARSRGNPHQPFQFHAYSC